ncbi:hypothetical protein [Klebsiella pneumoniae]|uniref:hypothetical protein n=1 Tax=Klebsiella pneumoniae TaxID=573 RepID=UPI00131C08A5|nr:hypothetical protein [Klebsiella pneumoniae]
MNELAKFSRRVVLLNKSEVDRLGIASVSKFFERKHSFLELGHLPPPVKGMSKEEFLRYVTVDKKDCHFVTKHYNWDSEGNLTAIIQSYNPIKSERVAKSLQEPDLPFKFYPRILRKKNEDGSYRSDIITFDVCWK